MMIEQNTLHLLLRSNLCCVDTLHYSLQISRYNGQLALLYVTSLVGRIATFI